jgi:hypothetical protein
MMNYSTTRGIESGQGMLPVDHHSELGQQVEYTPQQRANVIFLSYRFSQGGIGTQNRLLLNIEDEFMPNLFSEEGLDEMMLITKRMVGSYFLNPSKHPATAIPWNYDSEAKFIKSEQLVINELAGLFERFRTREELQTFSHALVDIAESVIVMDSDYLSRADGRSGDSKDLMIEVGDYERDPYESLLISHSVLNVSTNSIFYDQIFHRLAIEDTICQMDKYSIKQLRVIIELYQKTHDNVDGLEKLLNVREICERLANGEQ